MRTRTSAWTCIAALAWFSGHEAFAAPASSNTKPAPSDAGTKTRVVPNVGACKVDADCELVLFAPRCCDRACGRTAVGKQEAARGRLPRDCSDEKAGKCPPPAPCSREQVAQPLGAVCQAGTCSTVYEVK